MRASKQLKKQPTITSYVENNQPKYKAREAEIKLVGYITEHNIPFSAIDHLTDLLKSIFPDSDIAKNISLKRTKATNIVINIIGPIQKQNLANKLKHTKFSILVDEATDIACVKTLCIVVRFYDKSVESVVSQFWSIVQLAENEAEKRATAERLYKLILDSFQEMNVPFKNVLGFASDGCNTMMGRRSSISARMYADYPGLHIHKCICHSLHLVASEACKMLPRRCEDLCRDIHNYFKASAKRKSEFKEFQIFCELDPHKMLRPSQTRWLSLAQAVKRINEQWAALSLYFTHEKLESRLIAADTIYHSLQDAQIKLFYAFLEWILVKIASVNAYFQSEKVLISTTHSKMCSLYKDLLSSYMHTLYVQSADLHSIEPDSEANYMSIQNIYLGVHVMTLISKERYPQDLLIDFYLRCRQFLITACLQIKQRYDFADKLMVVIDCINPDNVINKKTHSLYNLLKLTPRIIDIDQHSQVQIIDSQWRELLTYDVSQYSNKEVDKFWVAVGNIFDGNGQPLFKELAEYCLNVLSIPHSNASCERIFSKVNLIKTKLRNKLVTQTINGLLLSSGCVGNCVEFQPSDIMMSQYNTATLYHKDHNSADDVDIGDIVLEPLSGE
ncbi:hat family dimerization domaincontaining protein-related [Holotrichia oblita]|uniref:Hat family dimerization domaincontaining protein-related n=1 Tax=Holotrichia oblita TaxID=644536 RepID=A0ACB9TM71_HOLOL|nr:hat family dimerization domaincontaining protein-related [Holotrichia oblita]